MVIDSDVEFGGTDQKFNLLVGRELQEMMGQRPQQCFLMPILVGTDGSRKMSKSLENYIAVEDPPNDMYGKVMSLPDGLIMQYFEYLTDVSREELEEMGRAMEADSVNPMELKKRLAGEITGQFHGAEDARSAAQHFERVVQRREAPEDGRQYLEVALEGSTSTSDVFIRAFPTRSRNELKRLISQGAVEYNGQKIYKEVMHQPGEIIKFGRRQFVKTVDVDTEK